MKKILITGANSYIGLSFRDYIKQFGDLYHVDTVDMKDGSWKTKSFSGYDALYHVAGIAHVRETRGNADLYYKVNYELAYETAKKAKDEGVKQFIFLSSMSVYGLSAGTISSDTVPNPKSNYGKSKLQAEEKVGELNDDAFCVSILRPPMVYGKGCRGNYPKFAKITLKTPIFPHTDNRRSMIYIDNLCEFVRIIIDKKSGGVFFPQNDEYVNTSALAKMINEAHGRKIRLLRFLGPPLSRISRRIDVISKVFGDLIYDETLRGTDFDYCVVSFEQSINITEKGDCSEV